MKAVKLISGFVVVAIATVTSLLVKNGSQERVNSLALSNIEALHASAGEAMCDASNDGECTIEVNGTVVGKGTGNMYIW